MIVGSLTGSALPLNGDSIAARVLSEELEIARGRRTGYSVVNKFGRNPDVDAGSTPEDVWNGGGVYTGFPAGAAERVEVFSSSAADAANGTGARTVRLSGLDNAFSSIEETVALNGLSPVLTSQAFRRLHRTYVSTSGAGEFNAGTITARMQTTQTAVFHVMPVGTNQTHVGAYTVPSGFTAYLRKLTGAIRGLVASSVDGAIWARAFGEAPRVLRPFTIVGGTAGLVDEIYGGLVLSEKTDVAVRIQNATGNNLDVVAAFDLILVAND